eukprot:g19452.t1
MQSVVTNAREFPPGWALVVVDMQNDFVRVEGEGKLSLVRKEVDAEGKLTPTARKNLEAMNDCIHEVRKLVKLQGWDLVVFTRDKHPGAEACTDQAGGQACAPANISFATSYFHRKKDKAAIVRKQHGISEYRFIPRDADFPLGLCQYTLKDSQGQNCDITQTLYPEHCVMS